MTEIPEREKKAAEQKRLMLRERGMQPIGWIFINPKTGERCTLDYWARVEWQRVDHQSGADKMAALRAERDRAYTIIADCDALMQSWRYKARQQVPADYAARPEKYYAMDNMAAGLYECAGDLAEILESKP